MARTAVALSGGGHRAALFGLGVLLYLVDAGKARDVVTISSVSGGSLTNGFVALHTDYQEATPAEFRMQVRSLIERIALSGTVWSSKCTWSYLVVLIVSFLALLGVWLLPLPFWAHLSLFIAGALTWAAAIASRRGEICGLALGNTLFSRNGTRARLDAINNKIDHVIAPPIFTRASTSTSLGHLCAATASVGARPVTYHCTRQCKRRRPFPELSRPLP